MMTRIDYRLTLGCLVCFSAFLAGCGDKLPYDVVALEGTVTYQGKPLEGVTVNFQPKEGRISSAISGPGGKFAMKYTYDVDGVQKGAGKFFLTMPEEAGSLAGTQGEKSPLLGEAVNKYSAEKSTLQVEVTEANTSYELELD
ncbi:MAG: hypothetical protein QM844_20785 [Planctomycetota bacterium]|jgi:hypothetical protein|nr:hypothetical protein [Planctomycetota bacterium]